MKGESGIHPACKGGQHLAEDWDDGENLGEDFKTTSGIAAAVLRGENRKDQTHQLYVNEPDTRGTPPSEELLWVASD
ncbi:hypothetical protein PSTT_00162, partial [Puccinia striiformis]